MKKYVKASRIGKTKEVFVVQEYTGYGNGWEDVCEYPDNSVDSFKQAKQDKKDYEDNGYSARIIRRRVPNPDYVAPEVTSSKSVSCASDGSVSDGSRLQNTTSIKDLSDDTVIRVDEVLDYARKYMKPEDIDHHGNGKGMDDLYLRVNDVSRWIVNHMDNTALVSKFVDNIDHVWWYELPFLYHD